MSKDKKYNILIRNEDGTEMYVSKEELEYLEYIRSIKGNQKAMDAAIRKAKRVSPKLAEILISIFYPN